MCSHRRWLAAVLVLGLTIAIGCRDLSAPRADALRGTFVLRSVGGSPFPVVPAGSQSWLVADTLTLDGHGHSVWISVTEDASQNQPPTLHRSGSEYDYTVTGFGITGFEVAFTYHCPPGAMCFVQPSGRLTPDGRLRLTMYTLVPPCGVEGCIVPIYTFVRVR
jgi:hypothetical protein